MSILAHARQHGFSFSFCLKGTIMVDALLKRMISSIILVLVSRQLKKWVKAKA